MRHALEILPAIFTIYYNIEYMLECYNNMIWSHTIFDANSLKCVILCVKYTWKYTRPHICCTFNEVYNMLWNLMSAWAILYVLVWSWYMWYELCYNVCQTYVKVHSILPRVYFQLYSHYVMKLNDCVCYIICNDDIFHATILITLYANICIIHDKYTWTMHNQLNICSNTIIIQII